jgi:hypothetical protein
MSPVACSSITRTSLRGRADEHRRMAGEGLHRHRAASGGTTTGTANRQNAAYGRLTDTSASLLAEPLPAWAHCNFKAPGAQLAITSTPLRPLFRASQEPPVQEPRTGYAAFAARIPISSENEGIARSEKERASIRWRASDTIWM